MPPVPPPSSFDGELSGVEPLSLPLLRRGPGLFFDGAKLRGIPGALQARLELLEVSLALDPVPLRLDLVMLRFLCSDRHLGLRILDGYYCLGFCPRRLMDRPRKGRLEPCRLQAQIIVVDDIPLESVDLSIRAPLALRLAGAHDELSCGLRGRRGVGVDLRVEPLVSYGDAAQCILRLVEERLGDLSIQSFVNSL